jgi:hypothetical protein
MSRESYISPRLRTVLAAFAGVATITGVAVQLFTAPSTMRLTAVLFLAGVAAILAITIAIPELARQYRAAHSLPSDSELDCLTTGYRVDQAMADELKWIAELERSVYSKEDAIPEHLLREWFAVNPTGFWIVRAMDGVRVGHLDVLPLRPATLQAFLGGDIVERELRGDSLFGPHERGMIKHLYIESIILRPAGPRASATALVAVLASAPALLSRMADLRAVEAIYAIAASRAGDRLMRKLGFEQFKAGERRRDGHDLFVARPSVLARRIVELCRDRILDPREFEGLGAGL